MNLRAALAFLLVIATPLVAQVVENPPEAQATPPAQEPAAKAPAPAPARKLKLVTEAVALNYIAKSDGSGGFVNSKIYEDPNGLIGIGLEDPANALHVKIVEGATNAPLKLETSGADSVSGLSLKNDARNWLLRVDGTDNDKFKIYDATASAYRFTIDDTGRVGLGTTSPLASLHLYSPTNSDKFMSFGLDPSGQTGSALNVGYGGNSFGIGSGFFNVRPDAAAVAPNPSLRFLTANVQRMIITNTGSVGIGTVTPGAKLSILSDLPTNKIAFALTQRAGVTSGSVAVNDTGLIAEALQDVSAGVTNPGGLIGAQVHAFNMGPGRVDWATGGVLFAGNYYGLPGNVTNAYGIQTGVKSNTGTVTNGYGIYIHDTEATNDYSLYQGGTNDTNFFAGNVIIGGSPSPATSTYALAVTGNVSASESVTIGPAGGNQATSRFTVHGSAHFNGTVTGTNIKAHYQDVAEWVPASSDLAPGTVVILNRGRSNEVMASAGAYDTTVAGVVSAQPGLSLGIEGEGKEQIATTGRVKVRVDARLKPIAVGDLLVTSDMPGTAMRSEPMSINGRAFHQPGTILGKALEPLEGGVGEILVLLSMQ